MTVFRCQDPEAAWIADQAAVTFTVYGKPAPAGSKRGFYNPKARRVIITDASKNSRPWKALVSDAATQAMLVPDNGSRVLVCRDLLRGPLVLEATFYFPRPKAHYRTGRHAGELRDNVPLYPAVKPDTTKLLRAVEDALTGIVWKDDAQVVNQWVRKMYGEPARCEVRVEELNDMPEIERALKRREAT